VQCRRLCRLRREASHQQYGDSSRQEQDMCARQLLNDSDCKACSPKLETHLSSGVIGHQPSTLVLVPLMCRGGWLVWFCVCGGGRLCVCACVRVGGDFVCVRVCVCAHVRSPDSSAVTL